MRPIRLSQQLNSSQSQETNSNCRSESEEKDEFRKDPDQAEEELIEDLLLHKKTLFATKHINTFPKEGIILRLKRARKNQNIPKEKSLGDLSKDLFQHLAHFNECFVHLDQITQYVGVERRRIYDIINILDSLGVVQRCGKNKYIWKGLAQISKTLEYVKKQIFNNFNSLFLF